ncbi:hypothetical protein Emag_006005 [Eimeria magna]
METIPIKEDEGTDKTTSPTCLSPLKRIFFVDKPFSLDSVAAAAATAAAAAAAARTAIYITWLRQQATLSNVAVCLVPRPTARRYSSISTSSSRSSSSSSNAAAAAAANASKDEAAAAAAGVGTLWFVAFTSEGEAAWRRVSPAFHQAAASYSRLVTAQHEAMNQQQQQQQQQQAAPLLLPRVSFKRFDCKGDTASSALCVAALGVTDHPTFLLLQQPPQPTAATAAAAAAAAAAAGDIFNPEIAAAAVARVVVASFSPLSLPGPGAFVQFLLRHASPFSFPTPAAAAATAAATAAAAAGAAADEGEWMSLRGSCITEINNQDFLETLHFHPKLGSLSPTFLLCVNPRTAAATAAAATTAAATTAAATTAALEAFARESCRSLRKNLFLISRNMQLCNDIISSNSSSGSSSSSSSREFVLLSLQPLAPTAAGGEETETEGASERQQQLQIMALLNRLWLSSTERDNFIAAADTLANSSSSSSSNSSSSSSGSVLCRSLMLAQQHDFFLPAMLGGCGSFPASAAPAAAAAAATAAATAAAVSGFLRRFQHPVLSFITEATFLSLRAAADTPDSSGDRLLVTLVFDAAAAAAAAANANAEAAAALAAPYRQEEADIPVSSGSPSRIAAYQIFGVSPQQQQQQQELLQQVAQRRMVKAQQQITRFFFAAIRATHKPILDAAAKAAAAATPEAAAAATAAAAAAAVVNPFSFGFLDGLVFSEVLETFGVYIPVEAPSILIFSPVRLVSQTPNLAFFKQQQQQQQQVQQQQQQVQQQHGWDLRLSEPAFYFRDRWALTLDSLEQVLQQLQQQLEQQQQPLLLQQHLEGYDWWNDGTWLRRMVGLLVVRPLRRPVVELLHAGVYRQLTTALWVCCCLILALIVSMLVCCNLCDCDGLAAEAADAAAAAFAALQATLHRVGLRCSRRQQQQQQQRQPREKED